MFRSVRRRPALAKVALAAASVAMVAAIALGAGRAAAQPSPYGLGDERAVPAPPPAAGERAPSSMPWAQPPVDNSHMRAPQQLDSRPSGFWTSNRPATHGAYRWRMLAVGGGVLAVTMLFVLRLLLRASRSPRSGLPAARAVER
jgi:hypothetical protein